jgi:Phasin protein
MSNRIQAEEHFARIAREWQDFVGRRVKEDFHLMHRLTQSGTPNQILVAYTDFWQKAAEDYGEEIATMSKLMTEVATKMATTMHAATHEASETR